MIGILMHMRSDRLELPPGRKNARREQAGMPALRFTHSVGVGTRNIGVRDRGAPEPDVVAINSPTPNPRNRSPRRLRLERNGLRPPRLHAVAILHRRW